MKTTPEALCEDFVAKQIACNKANRELAEAAEAICRLEQKRARVIAIKHENRIGPNLKAGDKIKILLFEGDAPCNTPFYVLRENGDYCYAGADEIELID